MVSKFKTLFFVLAALATATVAVAQETIPEPGATRPFVVPKLAEAKLPNGLTVAVVERSNVPLVTVRLVIRGGARSEGLSRAGLADLTAALATKHTKTRGADKIAEEMEFLGSGLVSGADWEKSVFSFTVAVDKLDAAMRIFGDVILNTTLDANELELLRAQALDNLAADLKEPAFLASYVASVYSYGEHPVGGTPESLKAISRKDIAEYRNRNHRPENSVLIFTGDIKPARANALATRTLGAWRKASGPTVFDLMTPATGETNGTGRILVIDLPDSGQSAVTYTQRLLRRGRVNCTVGECISNSVFFPATVTNSILGGGYSSRLNQEIRIKRGLSYGAGSGFSWRNGTANFATRTQTKDESAAEVAEIVVNEIKRLAETEAAKIEINPRKLVITGDYSREFETTAELAETVGAVYGYQLSPFEMTTFNIGVNAVTGTQVREFARVYLQNGDIVIAGDYRKFRDDLAKRFPGATVQVIEAARLDLSKESLQR
ncbi:MAG: insulinase family protein [Acidobacteria bacterium]|nr:insulinase family protein [Acidobacteriota bacterium]